jgi:uncharacterized membrane protein
MSRAAVSMFAFAVYLFVLGTILLVAPNPLLTLFGFEPTTEIFVRIVGTLVVFLGYYYLSAARDESAAFMRWTVQARPFLIVFFGAFVAFGWTKPQLILFAVPDLAGAVWTHLALRAPAAPAMPESTSS